MFIDVLIPIHINAKLIVTCRRHWSSSAMARDMIDRCSLAIFAVQFHLKFAKIQNKKLLIEHFPYN